MAKLFEDLGVDVAQLVADELGPLLLPATLTQVTPTGYTSGDAAGAPTTTTVEYTCRGYVKRAEQVGPNFTRQQVQWVVLLGATISRGEVVPQEGDRVTIDGATYVLGKLTKRDATRAAYTFRVTPPVG